MKALSLWQPWATLIAMGIKTIETRSWPTSYRGPLLIHAAKKRVNLERDLFPHMPQEHVWAWWDAMEVHCLTTANLPYGKVVAAVILTDCVRCTPDTVAKIPGSELPFGDFRDGRWMWAFSQYQPMDKPYAAVGRQGLFDLDEPKGRVTA